MRGRGEGVRQRVRGELGEWDYVSFFFFFFFVVFVVFVVFERRWEVGRYGEEMGKEGQKWIDR